jgi:hypothetical protein
MPFTGVDLVLQQGHERHGSQVFHGRIEKSEARDAQAEEGNAQERTQRHKGVKQETGDRHWPFRGP